MKKFGFCISLVTPPLQAWSSFYEDLVPLHSVYELSDERREVRRGCGQVYGRSSPGRAGDRRWVGTHSWRLDRTVNGQDVNSTSGIHSWNLGQSTSLRDLRRTINRFVTVEYPTHRSPTLSIPRRRLLCTVPCPFSELGLPLPSIPATAHIVPFRFVFDLSERWIQYKFFRAKISRHASFSTIIAYVMLI